MSVQHQEKIKPQFASDEQRRFGFKWVKIIGPLLIATALLVSGYFLGQVGSDSQQQNLVDQQKIIEITAGKQGKQAGAAVGRQNGWDQGYRHGYRYGYQQIVPETGAAERNGQ